MDTFGSFANRLVSQQQAMRRELTGAMDRIGQHVVHEAQGMFGSYQGAIGGFPAWPQLAASTQTQREQLGFTANDPLLRTGGLRDSVTYILSGVNVWDARAFVVTIGSPDPIMAYQEFGTMRIPPRPVIGPAAVRSLGYVHQEIGSAAIRGILGTRGPHADAYEQRTG